jgi:hypothetical protein
LTQVVQDPILLECINLNIYATLPTAHMAYSPWRKSMAMTGAIAIGSVVLGLPQALSGTIHIVQWVRSRRQEGVMPETKPPTSSTILAFVVVICALFMIGFGFWLRYHPLEPKIVEKPVIVEKSAPPCPVAQQKTGSGSTKGNNSPVATGNGNKFGSGGAPKSEQ